MLDVRNDQLTQLVAAEVERILALRQVEGGAQALSWERADTGMNEEVAQAIAKVEETCRNLQSEVTAMQTFLSSSMQTMQTQIATDIKTGLSQLNDRMGEALSAAATATALAKRSTQQDRASISRQSLPRKMQVPATTRTQCVSKRLSGFVSSSDSEDELGR